jgi:hypothetical protein
MGGRYLSVVFALSLSWVGVCFSVEMVASGSDGLVPRQGYDASRSGTIFVSDLSDHQVTDSPKLL